MKTRIGMALAALILCAASASAQGYRFHDRDDIRYFQRGYNEGYRQGWENRPYYIPRFGLFSRGFERDDRRAYERGFKNGYRQGREDRRRFRRRR